MNTMSISEFKVKAMEVLDQVARTEEPILVSRRGKPIVKVVPVDSDSDELVPGRMTGTVLEEIDIVSPLGPDLWGTAR